jgi:hypothetical protein
VSGFHTTSRRVALAPLDPFLKHGSGIFYDSHVSLKGELGLFKASRSRNPHLVWNL